MYFYFQFYFWFSDLLFIIHDTSYFLLVFLSSLVSFFFHLIKLNFCFIEIPVFQSKILFPLKTNTTEYLSNGISLPHQGWGRLAFMSNISLVFLTVWNFHNIHVFYVARTCKLFKIHANRQTHAVTTTCTWLYRWTHTYTNSSAYWQTNTRTHKDSHAGTHSPLHMCDHVCVHTWIQA